MRVLVDITEIRKGNLERIWINYAIKDDECLYDVWLVEGYITKYLNNQKTFLAPRYNLKQIISNGKISYV